MKNIIKFMKNNCLFILILVCATFLRFYRSSAFPPSLNWDEISHGYNSYSVLKTGMDEWGKKFPIINFRAYGDYPLTLNLYLSIPFISFFGLNEFSIRLPHMLLGVLTVFFSYYLVFGITKKKSYSLLTSLLVAIDPWFLFPSRCVFQSNLSIFLLITSMTFFFNRQKNNKFLPFSFFLLFLTLFSYHSTRIFSPLFLVSILFIYWGELKDFILNNKIQGYLSLGIIAVFIFIFPYILLKPESRARTQWVYLIDQGAINSIIEKRTTSKLPEFTKRFVYNKPTYALVTFTKNYLGYFSPRFLFLKGGTQYQFSNPNFGLLLYPNIIFFYIGLIVVIYKALKEKNKTYLLVLFWFLIAPVAAAITKEQYAVLRSTPMLPIPQLLSVMGFFVVYEKLTKNKTVAKIFFAIYIFSLIFSLFLYMKNLFGKYINDYSWSWQYGYKEAIFYVKENYLKYDRIIFTKKYGEPHEFVLFFWPWDPKEYMNDKNLIRFYQSGWYWVDSFGKFYFVNDWEIPKEENEDFMLERGSKFNCNLEKVKCLLVTSPGNFPKGWNKLRTINYLNGKEVFEIYEN